MMIQCCSHKDEDESYEFEVNDSLIPILPDLSNSEVRSVGTCYVCNTGLRLT